jgi:predicted DNA-binding transcriptional regulator AlpA
MVKVLRTGATPAELLDQVPAVAALFSSRGAPENALPERERVLASLRQFISAGGREESGPRRELYEARQAGRLVRRKGIGAQPRQDEPIGPSSTKKRRHVHVPVPEGKRGRLWGYGTKTLAAMAGMTEAAVKKAIERGTFEPSDLRSVVTWLSSHGGTTTAPNRHPRRTDTPESMAVEHPISLPRVGESRKAIELLTIEQLAALLGTTRKSLYVSHSRGLIPCGIRLPGVGLRWRREDVEQWIVEHVEINRTANPKK